MIIRNAIKILLELSKIEEKMAKEKEKEKYKGQKQNKKFKKAS